MMDGRQKYAYLERVSVQAIHCIESNQFGVIDR